MEEQSRDNLTRSLLELDAIVSGKGLTPDQTAVPYLCFHPIALSLPMPPFPLGGAFPLVSPPDGAQLTPHCSLDGTNAPQGVSMVSRALAHPPGGPHHSSQPPEGAPHTILPPDGSDTSFSSSPQDLCRYGKEDLSRLSSPYTGEVLMSHLNFLRTQCKYSIL